MYSSAPQGTVITRKGGVPWLSSRTAMHFPFERASKRRKGFPSETQVKRGQRIVGGDKYLVRNSAAMTPVHAALGVDFKKCCLRAKRFEGSARDDYF
jgi:hypothetical protein